MVVFKHHLNGESRDLEKSVGEESRIPSIPTPRDRMAKKALKTPDNNNAVRRSTRIKYLVQIFTMMALQFIITHTW
jgi:hypothetical protein